MSPNGNVVKLNNAKRLAFLIRAERAIRFRSFDDYHKVDTVRCMFYEYTAFKETMDELLRRTSSKFLKLKRQLPKGCLPVVRTKGGQIVQVDGETAKLIKKGERLRREMNTLILQADYTNEILDSLGQLVEVLEEEATDGIQRHRR